MNFKPLWRHQVPGEVRCREFRGSPGTSVPVDFEGLFTEGSSVHERVLTPVDLPVDCIIFLTVRDLASPLTGAGTKQNQAVKPRLQRGGRGGM